MSELDQLKVYGETGVGWCYLTPPNETVDEHGKPTARANAFNAADPRAPRRRVFDDPEVCRLREHLRQNNGIRGLEIVEPDEVERAARIFFRDGFVVVRDLLDADGLRRFREGSAKALKQILEVPGVGGRKYMTESFRLPHRYSYGTSSASRHMLHEPVWASMIDLPTTTPILSKIFGTDKYQVVGAGGDLCLPGAIEYQALHVDLRERETFELPEARLRQARSLGIKFKTRAGSGEVEHSSWQLIIERTPPMVAINFLMSDLTWENGPIRQIPGTQGRVANPPSPKNRRSALSTLDGSEPRRRGFRDVRAWHGATPNVGGIRAGRYVETAHRGWKTAGSSRRCRTRSGRHFRRMRSTLAGESRWRPGFGPPAPVALLPRSREEAKARVHAKPR